MTAGHSIGSERTHEKRSDTLQHAEIILTDSYRFKSSIACGITKLKGKTGHPGVVPVSKLTRVYLSLRQTLLVQNINNNFPLLHSMTDACKLSE